jgi:hypothetical protein
VWTTALAALLASPAGAQEPAGPSEAELQRRLEELEAKVRALEAGGQPAAPAPGAGPQPVAPAPGAGPQPVAPAPGAGPQPVAPAPGAGPQPIGPAAGAAPVESSAVGVSLEDGLLLELPLSLKLKVYGQVRFRGEFRDPRDYRVPGTFGRPATENPDSKEDFVSQRTWITLEFQVREHIRAAVGIHDSRLWGDQPVLNDAAELFLREGWAEVDKILDHPLKVRAGRMLLPRLGDQRLISDLDWNPTPRIWDGVQATWEPEGWFFTAIGTNLREAQVQTPRGDENDDFWFAGAYASNRMIKGCEFDAYLFWRELSEELFLNEAEPSNGFTTKLGDREDFSVGLRAKIEAGPVGATAEGVYQWGRQSGDPIDAFAFATKAWIKLPLPEDLPGLRIAAEYAYASGDRDPNDGRLNTFDPIFPFGHAYHGHMDLVLWSNIHAFSVQLTSGMPKPIEWLELHLDGHLFWLDKTKDAWYALSKTPTRRDPTGVAASDLGSEVDVYAQVRLWKNRIFVWTGFSQFFTAEYVRDTGKSEDQRWAFLMVEFNF